MSVLEVISMIILGIVFLVLFILGLAYAPNVGDTRNEKYKLSSVLFDWTLEVEFENGEKVKFDLKEKENYNEFFALNYVRCSYDNKMYNTKNIAKIKELKKVAKKNVYIKTYELYDCHGYRDRTFWKTLSEHVIKDID